MARLTCIVPVKDVSETLLDRAFTSIHCQHYRDLAIILVDNDSIATPAQADDSDVTYLRHATDLGLPASLNHGYAIADTPYVCMLAGDDWIEPGWFKQGTGMLDCNPAAWFVSPNTEHDLKWPEIRNGNYMHVGAMFRREAILDMGGYRDGKFFDWDMWCRLAKAGYHGISIPRNFYHWSPGGISQSIDSAEHQRLTEAIQQEHPL